MPGIQRIDAPADIIDVALGAYHCLLLRSNGEVRAWGSQSSGQLGDGVSRARIVADALRLPVRGLDVQWGLMRLLSEKPAEGTFQDVRGITIPQPVPKIRNAVAIAAASDSSFAVLADGTASSWGSNSAGILADGTSFDSDTPVWTLLADVASVSLSISHGLAVTRAGEVVGWGANADGQLGSAHPAFQATPIPIRGIQDVQMVAAGWGLSVALTRDGRVYTWGASALGGLGRRGVKRTPVPAIVPDLEQIVGIHASTGHVLALRQDGTVWGWGMAEDDQLGTHPGRKRQVAAPVQLADMKDVITVRSGDHHSIAITSDGSVLTCGLNHSATEKIEGLPPCLTVSAGDTTSVAVGRDGTVWVFGTWTPWLWDKRSLGGHSTAG